MKRTEYPLNLNINKKRITKIIIDQHYKEKHDDHMSDKIILDVLREIDGSVFDIIAEDEEYQYFKVEPVYVLNTPYRLIFLLFIREDSLGVINCFRVPRRKYE